MTKAVNHNQKIIKMSKWSKQNKAQIVRATMGVNKISAEEKNQLAVDNRQVEKERLEKEATIENSLWGTNSKYHTQAEYQRSCMGKKWN